MENAVRTELRSFVCVDRRFKKEIMPVEARTSETIIKAIPDNEEYTFYFFDSYVGIVDGVAYRFGPELNVEKYYCGGTYYPNPEHFKSYYMRCNGWTEEEIANCENNSHTRFVFGVYNKEHYPNGVLIVNGNIINPNDGTILRVTETISNEVFPDEATVSMYRNAD